MMSQVAYGAAKAGVEGLPVLERLLERTDDLEVLWQVALGAARVGAGGVPVLAWLLERTDDPEVLKSAAHAAP